MTIVVDTNVYVSAVLFPRSVPSQIIHVWEQGLIQIAVSEPILDEIHRVLRYPKIRKYHQWSEEKINLYIANIRKNALMTLGTAHIHLPLLNDPDDLKFLVCAVEAQADALVTGDEKHLLALKSVSNIPILTPQAYLHNLQKEYKAA